MSRKERKRLRRLSVAVLKQLVKRPEVVEVCILILKCFSLFSFTTPTHLTLLSWFIWSLIETLFPCLAIGAKNVNIFKENVVWRRPPSNYQNLLKQLVFREYVRRTRKKKIRKDSNKKLVQQLNPRWAQLILITKCCTTHSSDFRQNQSFLCTEMYTMKARKTRYHWRRRGQEIFRKNWRSFSYFQG